VTSIDFETGAHVPIEEVLPLVTRNFGFVFGSQILWLESLDDLLANASGLTAPLAPAPESATRPVAVRDGMEEPQDTPAKTPEELRRLHRQDTHFA
jgi:hypothetical protein